MLQDNRLNKIIKSVSFLTLLPLTLFAADNQYSNEAFSKAIDSYNNRVFQDSYLVFKEYSKKEKLDDNLSFILARSAYELGKFDEAEKLYKELLDKTPTNNRLKLELAQTYFQQKKYDEAEILYKEVLKDETLPVNVKNNIEKTLIFLNKKSQRNFFRTTLSVGYGYDSNVENISNDDYVYLGNLPLSIPNKRSDHVAEYALSLKHSYKLKDNLTIDNKFVGYSQRYNSEKENNLSLVVLGTGLSYYEQRYKLSLAFDYNYVWLDSKTYLNNYLLTPSFEYQIDRDLIYKTNLKLIKKDFKQKEYEFRDSLYYEWQNGISLLTDKFGINTLSMTLGSDNKNHGKHSNVDYEFITFRLENIYPLTSSTILSSSIEHTKDRYKVEEEVLYKNRKRDDKTIINLGVIQSLNKNLSIGANVRYINNDSNQNIYKYDKYLIKSNIYYSF